MFKKEGKDKKLFRYNFFPTNKKGQELSTNTIILIILGLAILVVLILGFSTGWKFFKNIISPTNVDSVIEECGSVCGLNQKYSFCSAEKTLRVNEEKFEVKTSCNVLANLGVFAKYNIQKCPAITCDLPCEEISIDAKKGTIEAEGITGKYDVSSLVKDLEEGKICIIN